MDGADRDRVAANLKEEQGVKRDVGRLHRKTDKNEKVRYDVEEEEGVEE